jgi:hypothetical protein
MQTKYYFKGILTNMPLRYHQFILVNYPDLPNSHSGHELSVPHDIWNDLWDCRRQLRTRPPTMRADRTPHSCDRTVKDTQPHNSYNPHGHSEAPLVSQRGCKFESMS